MIPIFKIYTQKQALKFFVSSIVFSIDTRSASLPTPSDVKAYQDGLEHFFPRPNGQRGGEGGLKLYKKCQYGVNTIQKGASLSVQ